MSTVPGQPQRVLSGMRPTGRLHLGHYHGVLKNWVRLQHEYECFFFVADWHALTTHWQDPEDIEANTFAVVGGSGTGGLVRFCGGFEIVDSPPAAQAPPRSQDSPRCRAIQ